MTTADLGALTRAHLSLVHVAVPGEGPAEHARNALQTLVGLQVTHPGVYTMIPELGRAARRIRAAVVMLENSGPAELAVLHLHRAIEALLDAPIDWMACPDVGCAGARLLRALFLLDGVQ